MKIYVINVNRSIKLLIFKIIYDIYYLQWRVPYAEHKIEYNVA